MTNKPICPCWQDQEKRKHCEEICDGMAHAGSTTLDLNMRAHNFCAAAVPYAGAAMIFGVLGYLIAVKETMYDADHGITENRNLTGPEIEAKMLAQLEVMVGLVRERIMAREQRTSETLQ